jgi:predicted phosphodiesterase
MMRIAIITDIHANFPALIAAMTQINNEGVDEIINLGDTISIGPQPRECMEFLQGMKTVRHARGNHDHWYVEGLPDPRPAWMTDGELEHQLWTHDQLGEGFKDWVNSWPWIIESDVCDSKLAFMHYALGMDRRSFTPMIRIPTLEDLKKAFGTQRDYYFYGHVHIESDIQGNSRYLTPGSLGCQKEPIAPFFLLEIEDDRLEIRKEIAEYDDTSLFEIFETRDVPERDFIYKAFFGGQFTRHRS